MIHFPAPRRLSISLLLCLVALALGACSTTNEPEIAFEDVTAEVGLAEPLSDWQLGHAAAWGDLNGDNRPDLYLGAFADRRRVFGGEDAPIPNPLFLSTSDGFKLSPEKSVRLEGERARSSFAMLVDLDNDRDLDLLVGTHTHPHNDDYEDRDEKQTVLFENTGGGRFRDVTPNSDDSDWPRPHALRNATAVDFNADGLLDLVWTDGAYSNWFGGTGRLILLANRGDFTFEDVTAEYGLPDASTAGTGLAIGDLNDDGRLDLFVADSNRLFVSDENEAGEWRFREVAKGQFRGPHPMKGREADDAQTCGAAFGDIDGDGDLDLLTAVHGRPGQIDLYLNETNEKKGIRFRHINDRVALPYQLPEYGITGMLVKGAHVAIQDMDQDGRNDLVFSILWRNIEGKRQPVVLRNLGLEEDGVPRFDLRPLQHLVTYAAPGPVVDYDRDGRLDVSFVSWFEPDEAPTRLYRNVSDTGNHLVVNVIGDGERVNTMGIGATVRIYEAGRLGEADALLGRQDVTIAQGYSGATEPRVYFGLGAVAQCDVEVAWQQYRAVRRNVEANQTLHVPLPDDYRKGR